MANSENSRSAALAALRAYQAIPGFNTDNGDASDLGDLLADLAHLADTFEGEDEIYGGYALEHALEVYAEEVDGAMDERDDEDDFGLRGPESIDDNPYGDEGQTVPDDLNIPAGAPKPTDRLPEYNPDGPYRK